MKRKICPFCDKGIKEIDYKDSVLRNFLTDKGKIFPARVSGTCARHQRKLTRAIKRARNAALVPYTVR
jgi:small subunit ribosomal protein S18